jgi:hypothetical protein
MFYSSSKVLKDSYCSPKLYLNIGICLVKQVVIWVVCEVGIFHLSITSIPCDNTSLLMKNAIFWQTQHNNLLGVDENKTVSHQEQFVLYCTKYNTNCLQHTNVCMVSYVWPRAITTCDCAFMGPQQSRFLTPNHPLLL